MLIVIIIITVLISLLCLMTDWEALLMFIVPALIIEVIALIICISSLVGFRNIDKRIELYTAQNKEIEKKVELVVKEYMDFESNTYIELNNDESYITLVSLYPDLKSDELIKTQIELYTSNNDEILRLKEKKLNKTIYKWWVYFGK